MSESQHHDVIAEVRLLTSAAGGRSSPTPADILSCLFVLEGETFDCRLFLREVGPISPGQSAVIPIKFLNPDLVIPRLDKGTHFQLRDYRPIAVGNIIRVEPKE